MFEFSKMIYTNDFIEKNFQNFINKYNLTITDLRHERLTLRRLKNRLNELDSSHETCGNYLLFNKNLTNELFKNTKNKLERWPSG